MSDELERRLREAGLRLPGPSDIETHRARSRVLAGRARRTRGRWLPVLAAAAIAGGAFGGGYAVAAGGKAKPKLIVKHVPARLNAGPGFLPDPDWTVTGSATEATATSANGTRIDATFSPASVHRGLPTGSLGLPDGGRVRGFIAHVGAYAVQVTVTFPSGQPAKPVIVATREELRRLVVPSCPAALPLRTQDVAAAKRYVLRWLPAHYDGNPADVSGATATAHAGKAMPRHGEAAVDCGAAAAARSVEVDVVLPKVAKVSASLSELTFFVARAANGWTVWERAR